MDTRGTEHQEGHCGGHDLAICKTGIESVRETNLHPFLRSVFSFHHVGPWGQTPIPPSSKTLPFLLNHAHLMGKKYGRNLYMTESNIHYMKLVTDVIFSAHACQSASYC